MLAELCGPETAGLLSQDRGRALSTPSGSPGSPRWLISWPPRRRLVYLVIDDLHAAEPGAVLLTRFIARMRHHLPMLMVVTVRRRLVSTLWPGCTSWSRR